MYTPYRIFGTIRKPVYDKNKYFMLKTPRGIPALCGEQLMRRRNGMMDILKSHLLDVVQRCSVILRHVAEVQ